MKRIGDLLAVSLILISIFIFAISLREVGLIKWIGLIGSSVLFIVEGTALYQMWTR